jgi:hypothetical protein
MVKKESRRNEAIAKHTICEALNVIDRARRLLYNLMSALPWVGKVQPQHPGRPGFIGKVWDEGAFCAERMR